MEYKNFINNERLLRSLSQEKLKNAIKILSKIRTKKYDRKKYCIQDEEDKPMPDEVFFDFLGCLKPEEWRFNVFLNVMRVYGLRSIEAVKINLKDIDFQLNEIVIHTAKLRMPKSDMKTLHEGAFKQMLLDYIGFYEEEIIVNDGFLFFSRDCRSVHWTTKRVREMFHKVRKRSGHTQIYHIREEHPDFPQTKGKLYKYSLKSLRHSFGRQMADEGVPMEWTQLMLRHRSINSTQVYYHRNKPMIREAESQVMTGKFEGTNSLIEKHKRNLFKV